MSQIVHQEKDCLLALALASGTSVDAAAAQFEVCSKTIYRRLADPEFRRQVADYRGQLFATAFGRIVQGMTRAIDALLALLDSPQEHIRLRAIRLLLSSCSRLRDSVDLADQIRDLRAEVTGQKEEPS
jgi:hypothetical protein